MPRRSARLTPREHEILRAIADGLSYREIAERSGISYKTVSNVAQDAAGQAGRAGLRRSCRQGWHFDTSGDGL